MAESVRRRFNTPTGRAAAPRPTTLVDEITSARLAPALVFALALGLGVIVRFAAIGLGDGFPLNDGGMFHSMIEDLKRANYALPEFTSYNGGDIPFAYPPLPFYFAAALSDLTGWSTIGLLRSLPLAFSILTIPAFWLLARSMLQKPLLASVACLLFVSIPRSYNWEVIGGGLTRAPAMFFATLALWQAYELFSTGNRRHLLPAALLSATTVLCHMEFGWFVAFSTLLFVIWHRKEERALPHAVVLAVAVALLTAPWYVEVVLRSGHEPLLNALRAGGHSPVVILAPLLLRFTDDVWFSLPLALGMLGILIGLRDRRYLLLLWLLAIFLLDPRKAATVSTLPLAMLATSGFVDVVWPLLRRRAGLTAPAWAFAALGFLLVLYAPAAAVVSSTGPSSPLFALPTAQREAMQWVHDNTPETATFIVIPSASAWSTDAAAEWFPDLASRESLSTVQGSEWLSTYAERQEAYKSLSDCTGADVACVEDWRTETGATFSHIYLPKGESAAGKSLFSRQQLDCCARLIESLRTAPDYRLVYENAGAAVFERITP